MKTCLRLRVRQICLIKTQSKLHDFERSHQTTHRLKHLQSRLFVQNNKNFTATTANFLENQARHETSTLVQEKQVSSDKPFLKHKITEIGETRWKAYSNLCGSGREPFWLREP